MARVQLPVPTEMMSGRTNTSVAMVTDSVGPVASHSEKVFGCSGGISSSVMVLIECGFSCGLFIVFR